ncbi:MAG: lysophospholipid acyltransferase family protein [Gammaproteobacteria bacterium]|nr:lysophospholipid acyltransferase family protein [Gammaproteobacteria bacterium]
MMNKALFHPKHAIYWLLLGMLWLLVQLPYGWFMRMGKGLGYVASFIPHYNREVTLINLRLCFPEKAESERVSLMRRSYQSLLMAMLETVFSCFASEKRLRGLLHLQNPDFLQACGDQGVLIVVPHYHVLEIVGRLLSLQVRDLSAVYRPHRKPVIEYMNKKHLSANFVSLIPRTQGKAMIRLLRDGGRLLFLPDIDAGKKHSVFANFFNIPTASVASVPKLVKLGRAKVIVAHAYRRADLSGYELSFSAPVENYPSESILDDVGRINDHMERLIREHPEQYLWQYRRFKTRPVGEADVYPKKKVRKRKC